MAKNGLLGRVAKFELLGQPVGKAIVWSAGFGVAEALGSTLENLIPLEARLGMAMEASLAKAILAVLVKMKFVQRFIGASAANVLATAAWVLIVEEQLQVRRRIRQTTRGLTAMLPFGGGAAASASAQISGLGDIDTVIPVEGDFDEFQGLGAADMMLTSLEGKLAAIAG
jgi:hypothetical protein